MSRATTVSTILYLILSGATAAAEPPSAQDFGRLPAISNITVSPDGKHLAALTSQDGETAIISVWNTDDLTKPVGIGGNPRVRFMGVNFAKNERLSVDVRQLF
ncbi:MAG: hypothetical protein B7Z26_10035, partial [Asticcacaulis sp. 32-58-5]